MLSWGVGHVAVHLVMPILVVRMFVIGWWTGREWLNAGPLLLTVRFWVLNTIR